MLTASPALGPSPAEVTGPRPTTVNVRIRRRRSVTVLAVALAAASTAAALTGADVVWGAAAAIGVLAITYVALLARFRHLATEREMSIAFARDTSFDWVAFERELAAEARRSPVTDDAEEAAPAVEIGHLDLGRFLAAYALGWVLTPVVAVIRLAGGDVSDLQRHRVVQRLVRAQEVGRSQSLRLLAAGVVATAGVAAVGGLAAGVVSAPPAFAAPAGATTYTVRSGDTLSSIAARFATTVSAVASANGISDPNLIFPGQELTIPGGSGSGSSDGADGTYTVQAGDTLGSIASRFGTTVSDLASLNHLSDPNLIFVGETLEVDGTASPATTTTTAASTSSNGTYTVQAGDTLGSIASRFGTTVANLAALNHLSNPNVIYVGEVLKVDGTAPATTTTASTGSGGSSSGSSYAAKAAIAVKTALAQVGVPYVYGGATPSEGFDCSGLVMYAWAAAGVSLPHNAAMQWEGSVTHISESQLQPGDLVFYNNYSGPQPGHVTMYVGNGEVVAANDTGTRVQVQSLSYDGTIWGYGQVNI